MKKIIILTLALAIFVSGCKQKSEPVTPQKPVVKIGCIFPLSGSLAFWGEALRDAILWSQENIGETKYRYKIIFEDHHMEKTKTASIMQKMINVDKVDVLISADSDNGKVVSPVAERNHIIHFGLGSALDIAKGEYNFIHCTPAEDVMPILVKTFQEKNLHRIAMFTLNHQGGKDFETALRNAIKDTDIEIVSQETIPFSERDFRLSIQKAAQKNPDVYFIWLFPPQLEIFFKQCKELEIPQPVTTYEMFAFSTTPEFFEGSWFFDPYGMSAQNQKIFRKRYNHPSLCMVGNAYNIIEMIVHAYENTPSKNAKPTTKEVAQTLNNLKEFDGILGKVQIDDEGIVHSKISLKEIHNGIPIAVENKTSE